MTFGLEVTILGCGSSAGTPRADGAWGACDPANPKNRRSRCSLMVRRISTNPDPAHWTTLIVDAAPELRLQTTANGARRLDALLLTHDHADQCHGIDDIRAFALIQRGRVAVWMDEATATSVGRRFGYIFHGEGAYPPIADIHATPPWGVPFAINGPSGPIEGVCFDQDHGGVRSLGYRFGDVAYCSDVVGLPEDSMRILEGLDVWIVDALRWTPHPTHAHVERALEWIAHLRPKRAILTNMHIDLDYADLAARLPPGVEPAFDGLRFLVESARIAH